MVHILQLLLLHESRQSIKVAFACDHIINSQRMFITLMWLPKSKHSKIRFCQIRIHEFIWIPNVTEISIFQFECNIKLVSNQSILKLNGCVICYELYLWHLLVKSCYKSVNTELGSEPDILFERFYEDFTFCWFCALRCRRISRDVIRNQLLIS